MSKPKTRRAIRLSPDLIRDLEDICKKTPGCVFSRLVEDILTEYVEKQRKRSK